MVWGIPWTEKDKWRKANILLMKIPEKLYGYGKEGINPTKGRTRRGELGGWPKEPEAYPNQQLVIIKKKKKKQLVELLKNMKIYWCGLIQIK